MYKFRCCRQIRREKSVGSKNNPRKTEHAVELERVYTYNGGQLDIV